MRLNRFDLNQVVCLEALLSECSVSRAAERVHLSQSAMSAVLAQLRDYFGDPLLVRSGRALVPTPFARSLIQPVNELLTRAHALTALSPDRAPSQVDREMTIATSDYSMAAFMTEAIKRMAKPMPNLRFDVLPLSNLSASILNNGEIDLLVAGRPLDVGRPANMLVCEDRFVCLVSTDHEPDGGVLDADEFLARRHVVVRYFESQLTFEDEEALRRLGLRRPRQVSVGSMSLVPQMIAGTALIATGAWRISRHFSQHWPIKVYPFPFAQEPMRIFAYWHPSREEDPVLQQLMDTVRDVVAETPDAPV